MAHGRAAGTRRDAMLAEGKNAVVYGGGGAIGGAVARAFAREGDGWVWWVVADPEGDEACLVVASG